MGRSLIIKNANFAENAYIRNRVSFSTNRERYAYIQLYPQIGDSLYLIGNISEYVRNESYSEQYCGVVFAVYKLNVPLSEINDTYLLKSAKILRETGDYNINYHKFTEDDI